MSEVMFVSQGERPEDNFYGLDYEVVEYGYPSPLTLSEMGLTAFAAQLEQFITEVGPVLGKVVLDIGNMNEMCMKLTELQNRTRD